MESDHAPRARRLRARAAAALLLALATCGGTSDPVSKLLEDIRVEAEDRDAQGVAGHLADDFQGAGGTGRAEAVATLRRYFAAYESVSLTVYDVAVLNRSDTAAAVRCLVEFRGAPRRIGGLDGFLPPSAVQRFEMRMAKRGDAWKVIAADWRPVEPPAGAGP